ncbi:MAG: DNA repair protein RecN [Candidatus Nanopelagicales bacterium]
MIEFIRLVDLGIIDEAEVDFGPGFTVITGETGAGKTMVLSALDMLLGGSTKQSLAKSANTKVQGGWAIETQDPLVIDLRDSEVELDEGLLLLSRSLPAGGRSKCTAGTTIVPQVKFSEWGDQLVAVHGQSDQVLLRKPAAQREALDRFAGSELSRTLADYQTIYARYVELKAQVEQATSAHESHQLERDQLMLALERIEKVDPQPGELDELLGEVKRLGNVDELESAAQEALQALAGEDDQQSNAIELIERARRALGAIEGLDSTLGPINAQLAETSVSLSEASSELSRYVDGLDAQPGRLAEVQARIASLNELVKLHGPTLDDVIAWSGNAAKRVGELEQQLNPGVLQAELNQVSEQVATQAAKLTALRTKAAQTFGQEVTEELQGLMMADSDLRAAVNPSEPGPFGADAIEFQLSAHRGGQHLPLANAASGGELSRVMLALEVVLAKSTTPKTMVFDEIDAGVGGKAATQIGKRLAQLGEHSQVIVVTHLPQVAAFANRHLVVSKTSGDSVTTSDIRAVSGDERVRELSRMMAGQEDSELAAAHAKELLELSGEL